MKSFFGAILLTALFLIPQASQAQISDKIVPHLGFMWEFFQVQEADNSRYGEVVIPSYYTFCLGGYYYFAHRNDVMSVGVDATAQVGLNFISPANQFRVNFLGQLPVYLTARLGALSTPYNTQPVGISLGVGGGFNYINTITNTTFGLTNVTGLFVIPQAMLQLTFRGRGSYFTGRIHAPLLPVQTSLNFPNAAGTDTRSPYDVSNFGIGVIYGF